MVRRCRERAFEPLTAGAYNTTIPDLPGGGPYNVVAEYSGDTKFAPSKSAAFSVTVSAEPSVVSVSAINGNNGNPVSSVPAGTLILVRVDVAGQSGQGFPTGQVTLQDADATDGATLKLNSFGFAELQTAKLCPGDHSFTATYSGDASFMSDGCLHDSCVYDHGYPQRLRKRRGVRGERGSCHSDYCGGSTSHDSGDCDWDRRLCWNRNDV